jgi:hypothetical protein
MIQHFCETFTNSCQEFTPNKIEGTPILKLAMVKILKVKKMFQKKIIKIFVKKIRQKICQKNSLEKIRQKKITSKYQ